MAAPLDVFRKFAGYLGNILKAAINRFGPGRAKTDSGQTVSHRLASALQAIREHPRLLIVPAVALGSCALIALVMLIAMTPPEPISSGLGPYATPDARTKALLESLVVPYDDPLVHNTPLDRRPKSRYTREDVERNWRELGDIDASELRRKNIADLEAMLEAVD